MKLAKLAVPGKKWTEEGPCHLGT